jgi:CHASE1-domain containing sensor protein
MNEERMKHEQNPEVEFEHRDLNAGSIFAFLFGLAIFGLIIFIVLLGMYKFMDRYTGLHQPPVNPLATPVVNRGPQALPQAREKFPEPRLEVNERTELQDFLQHQEQRLHSYGWVNEKAGVMHIPIDVAIRIVVQRGLPTRSPASTPARVPGQQKTKPSSPLTPVQTKPSTPE